MQLCTALRNGAGSAVCLSLKDSHLDEFCVGACGEGWVVLELGPQGVDVQLFHLRRH